MQNTANCVFLLPMCTFTYRDKIIKDNPNDRIYVGKLSPQSSSDAFSSSVLIKQISINFRIAKTEIDDAELDIYPQGNFFLDYFARSIIDEELNEALWGNTRKRNQIEKALALSSNIVGITCNRAAAYDFRDTTEMFDVAIIDEVCKATLPEMLSPLIISKKAILLGDPKQLPPVFCSAEQDVIRSIEHCNLNNFMYIDTLFADDKSVTVLETQYRMSNQIGNMISDFFYHGSIKNGRNEDIEDSLSWITYKPSRKWPIRVEEESDKPKIYNEDESAI